MREEWKDIIGFEGRYEVSTHGRVRSNLYTVKHILSPMIHYKGHLYVHLYDEEGKRRKLFIHRLVAIAFFATLEDLQVVNHIDGNKKNNRIENLEAISSGDNTRHYYNGVRRMEDHEMAF